jgi:hypothetical protein
MPAYPGTAQAQLLRDNNQAFLWQLENPPVGSLSVAFQLERINRTFYPWGASFEVVFGGNPGAFEIDIMGANSDTKANFLQIGNITNASGSVVAGAYVGRWDMASNIWVKYVAAYIKTLANAVSVTLQVTR